MKCTPTCVGMSESIEQRMKDAAANGRVDERRTFHINKI